MLPLLQKPYLRALLILYQFHVGAKWRIWTHIVKCGNIRSWDDVFGQPHPKNVKLGAKADERKKSLLIFRRVKEILYINPSKAIDRSLFGEVGKEFGVGDSLAEKYYYQWNKRLNKKI
jgi:hypothetical protein